MPDESQLEVVYDRSSSIVFNFNDPTSLKMVREVLERAGCTGSFRLSHCRGITVTGSRNGIQSIRYKRGSIWVDIQPDNKKDCRFIAILIPPHDSDREDIAKKMNVALAELRQLGKKPKETRNGAEHNGATPAADHQPPASNPDITAVGPPDPELELLQEHDEIDTHLQDLAEKRAGLDAEMAEAIERLKDADNRKAYAYQLECAKRREIAALQEQIDKILADIRPHQAVQEEQQHLRQLAEADISNINLRKTALNQSEDAQKARQQEIAAQIAIYDESRRQLRLSEAQHRMTNILSECNLPAPEQIAALRALLANLESAPAITTTTAD